MLPATLCCFLFALGDLAVPQDDTAQVLVLGTFHFAAQGGSLNPTIEDILGDTRQAELEELVDRLVEFEPTRVALETPPDSTTRPSRYRQFVEEGAPLAADELEQVGFRIAEALGHETVHGIDHYQPVDIEGALAWAARQGQEQLARELMDSYVRATSRWTPELMQDRTMLESFQAFNDPQTDEAIHQVMVSALRIGSPEEPVGAALVSRWYDRNIRIAGNVVQLAGPGDRILVLIGANHRKLLIEFLERTPGIEVVSARSVLAGD